MTRQKNKIKGKKMLKIGASVLSIILLLKIITVTAPYITSAVSKAAVFSAGLNMPEGAINYIENGSNDELYDKSLSNHENDDTSNNEDTSIQENPLVPVIPDEQSAVQPTTATNNSGQIVRKTYKGGGDSYISIGENTLLKNSSNLSADAILQDALKGPVFQIEKTDEPQVLIYHTHATESYEDIARDFYDSEYNARSTDNNFNMVRVGDEICKQLEASGIAYIHDITQHDYPSYNGSYNRSAETIQSYLDRYPSIKVAIDVHRDAIEGDGIRYAPVAAINGQNAAQVMIISGCEKEDLYYPNYMNNLRFAVSLQNQMENDYPGLTRPILFKNVRYNQHLTNGSVLIEVGGHGNSLDEALYSGELIGKALAHLLSAITV